MDNFNKFYNKVLFFLSFRPRSEKEIKDYLSRKLETRNSKLEAKEREQLINSIINKLKEQKFLDDLEFAKWWIESRIKHKPKAWKIIKYELKVKGISEEMANGLWQMVNRSTRKDFESALSLAQKRIKGYEKLDRQKKYERTARYLASKGFDYDIVKKVIDQILSKGYNE